MDSHFISPKKDKVLLWKCLHNGLPGLMQIQTFYDRLRESTRACCRRTSDGKRQGEAFALLENTVANNY